MISADILAVFGHGARRRKYNESKAKRARSRWKRRARCGSDVEGTMSRETEKSEREKRLAVVALVLSFGGILQNDYEGQVSVAY